MQQPVAWYVVKGRDCGLVQELADSCGMSGNGPKWGTPGGVATAYLASLLASVPERAASTQLPALRPQAFIPQVSLSLEISIS